IPPEALVIDGSGLTVYPGLVDAFTDVGIPAAAAPSPGEGGGPRRSQEQARGPQDRPASMPWRSGADEANLTDKRIETWRDRGIARPRYDRTEAALAEALEDQALVLVPANNSVQLRRAIELIDRWQVKGAIYGGQMAYEVASEIAAKKLPVLVDLKWPEAEKDADPEAKPSLRTLRFRDRAPSTPAALAK